MAQVDPIKPTLKAPVIKLLKLKCDDLRSNFAFKFNLSRCIKAAHSKQSMVLERKIGKHREAATGRAPGAVKTKAGLHASVGTRHDIWSDVIQLNQR